jgi:hypothetical protein
MNRNEVGVGLAHESEITLKKTGFSRYFIERLITDVNFALIVKKFYESRDHLIISPFKSSSPNDKLCDLKLSCDDFGRTEPILSLLGINPVSFFNYVARNESFARFLVLALFVGERIFDVDVDEEKLYALQEKLGRDIKSEKDKSLQAVISAFFSNPGRQKYTKKIVLFSVDDYAARFNRGDITVPKVFSCMESCGVVPCNAYETLAVWGLFSNKEVMISLGSCLDSDIDKGHIHFPLFYPKENKSFLSLCSVYRENKLYGDIRIAPECYFAASFE